MFWFWRRWGHRVRRRYRAALWQRDDFQRDVSGGNRSKRTLLETAFQQLLDLFQESERFPASLWGQNQETQNIFSSPGPSVCRNVVPTFILVMGYNLWKVLTNWRKSVQTDSCLSWRSLEQRTGRSFWLPDYRKLKSGFIGASPRLLLICSCVMFRQQIVLLHLLFSFCLQLHLPHLSPDIPTVSPPHISISPLSLCLTWA